MSLVWLIGTVWTGTFLHRIDGFEAWDLSKVTLTFTVVVLTSAVGSVQVIAENGDWLAGVNRGRRLLLLLMVCIVFNVSVEEFWYWSGSVLSGAQWCHLLACSRSTSDWLLLRIGICGQFWLAILLTVLHERRICNRLRAQLYRFQLVW